MSMKIIELVIDEDAENVGVEAVSLVHDPAIELDWVALSKQKKYSLKLDEEKRVVTGPALVPQKQIFRSDKDQGDYYIYFSKQTVAKCNELFFKGYNQKNTTFEHEYAVEGNTIIESWIKEDNDKDKSNLYNFDAPIGTWFISMKIDNDEVWEAVKSQKVRGFSIEGHFADALQLKKHKFESMIVNENFAIIDDRLAYSTLEMAEKASADMGVEGIHEHEYEGQTWYMAGAIHELSADQKLLQDIKKVIIQNA